MRPTAVGDDAVLKLIEKLDLPLTIQIIGCRLPVGGAREVGRLLYRRNEHRVVVIGEYHLELNVIILFER